MSPFIIADKYMEQIAVALGIPYEKTRRIIIDARAGHAVLVYVEMLGTDDLLKFTPVKISDAEIKQGDA